MGKILRALVVEDNQDDVFVMLRELRRGGFEVNYRRVETANDMADALDNDTWDVILSDYSMPKFSAPDALRLVQQKGRDIPFIIVSGTIGEDAAVACLRAGAHDFFAKDKIVRLVPAVEREIRQAEDRLKRQQAERALQASEARYRAIVEDQTELVCRYLPDGTLSFINEAICAYFHTTQEELLGQNFWTLFSGSDLKAIEQSFVALSSEQPLAIIENQVVLPSGIKWHQWTHRAMFDAEGYFVEFQAVGRDITERKIAEEALQLSEERYRSVVTTMDEGMILQDVNGYVVTCNPSAERIFGISAEHWSQVSPDDPRWQAIQEDGTSLLGPMFPSILSLGTGQLQSNVVLGVHKSDGDLIWILANSVPLLHVGLDKPYAVLTTFADITARKLFEAQQHELDIERAKMQTLNSFIRDTSHDLRTPLTIFQTGLYLLRKQSSSEKALLRIDGLEEQANRMQSIIENMLAVSHLDTIAEDLHFEPCQLNELIGCVAAEAETLVCQKEHKLVVDLMETEFTIQADKKELSRALQHLLVNAIIYTNNGGTVGIHSRICDDAVIIEITDSGIGIAAQDINQIFTPFFRADKARGTTTGGAGLGLTIAKAIVQAHNGSIEVESIVGQGSSFRVRLPQGDASL